MTRTPQKIGFIGAGHMAQILIKGMLDQGWDAALLSASARGSSQRAQLQALDVAVFADNADLARSVDCVVLAVRPQSVKAALTPLQAVFDEHNPLLLSIVAGTGVQRITALLDKPDMRVVRAMPNMPALVGAAATALYGHNVQAADKHCAEAIMAAVGLTLWLPIEQQLDAVTAVSGSGPAYFLFLMEAIIDAGVSFGLTYEQARALTLQTAYGTAKLAQAAADTPAALKAQVTSKGGTTEAALAALNADQFSVSVGRALQAARDRAAELARL